MVRSMSGCSTSCGEYAEQRTFCLRPMERMPRVQRSSAGTQETSSPRTARHDHLRRLPSRQLAMRSFRLYGSQMNCTSRSLRGAMVEPGVVTDQCATLLSLFPDVESAIALIPRIGTEERITPTSVERDMDAIERLCVDGGSTFSLRAPTEAGSPDAARGTISGEHGIDHRRKGYLPLVMSAPGLA